MFKAFGAWRSHFQALDVGRCMAAISLFGGCRSAKTCQWETFLLQHVKLPQDVWNSTSQACLIIVYILHMFNISITDTGQDLIKIHFSS